MYDNRDFLYLIKKEEGKKEKTEVEGKENDKKEKYDIIKLIKEDIPNVVKHYKKFLEEKKICLTIGEFKMNYSYYINDFLENNDIFWFRCIINRRFSYVIISDLYFIILHIIKENRQKGKMKFYIELNKLKEIKVFPAEKKINLLWEEDPLLKDVEYKHEIVFENPISLTEFNEKINSKKNKLMQTFDKFDDDQIRNTPSNIIRMINYFEALYTKIKNNKQENKNDKNKSNTNNQINKIKDEKHIDVLYIKNMLIIYYQKALNLYCLEEKIKEKYNSRLNQLTSVEGIKK